MIYRGNNSKVQEFQKDVISRDFLKPLLAKQREIDRTHPAIKGIVDYMGPERAKRFGITTEVYLPPPPTSIQNPQPNQPQTAQVQQAPQTQQEVQATQEPVARRKRTATTRRRTALSIESQVNVPTSSSGGIGAGTSGVNVP
jgi:hypothetical protein